MTHHACLKHPHLLCASLQAGAYQSDCSACLTAMQRFATAYACNHTYKDLVAQIKSELTARLNARTHAAEIAAEAWAREERQALEVQRTHYAHAWLQPSNAGVPITDAKRYSSTAPMWKK